jgi:hypothetical protein
MRLAARRVPMLFVGLLSMACGMWLGLVRLGWNLPLPWQDVVIAHGPLMVCGFLGTLISLERAVGLGSRWGYAAPVLVAAGALMLDLDPIGSFGPIMITAGSLVMVAIFVVVWRRHASLFVATMTMGALAWTVGNVQWLGGAPMFRVVFWWLAFLVLTIAGERLELNRVLRPTRAVRSAFAPSAWPSSGWRHGQRCWPRPMACTPNASPVAPQPPARPTEVWINPPATGSPEIAADGRSRPAVSSGVTIASRREGA